MVCNQVCMKNFLNYTILMSLIFFKVAIAQTQEDVHKLYCPSSLICSHKVNGYYSICTMDGKMNKYWGRHNETKNENEIMIFEMPLRKGVFYLNKVLAVYSNVNYGYKGPSCQYDQLGQNSITLGEDGQFIANARFKPFLDSATQWEISDNINKCYANGHPESCPMVQKAEVVVNPIGYSSREYDIVVNGRSRVRSNVGYDTLIKDCGKVAQCSLSLESVPQGVSVGYLLIDLTKENIIKIVKINSLDKIKGQCITDSNKEIHCFYKSTLTKDPLFNTVTVALQNI